MNTIDYVYRFDPKNPSVKPSRPTPRRRRRTLEDGNRMFSQWMESCRTSTLRPGERAAVRRPVQRPGSGHGPHAGPDAQAGAVRRGRRLLRRPRADRDDLRPGVQRPVRDPRGRQRAGRRVPGQHRLRAQRPERERQGRGRARPQRLRRGDRRGRRLPAAAEVLVEVDVARCSGRSSSGSSSRSARRPTA